MRGSRARLQNHAIPPGRTARAILPLAHGTGSRVPPASMGLRLGAISLGALGRFLPPGVGGDEFGVDADGTEFARTTG